MSNHQLQGPIHSAEVLNLLAWEDNRAREYGLKWGTYATDAYFRAWVWLNSTVTNQSPGYLPWNAKRSLILVQTNVPHRAQVESSLRATR